MDEFQIDQDRVTKTLGNIVKQINENEEPVELDAYRRLFKKKRFNFQARIRVRIFAEVFQEQINATASGYGLNFYEHRKVSSGFSPRHYRNDS